MSSYTKWLGGGLGWVLGGPIGAIIGFMLGSAVDNGRGTRTYDGTGQPYGRPQTTPSDFSVTLLVLTAAVMKADGRVVKAELDYVKDFLKRSFGLQQAKDMTLALREIVEKDFDFRPVCRQIAQYMDHAGRLELLHLLFGLALADGELSNAELKVLEEIAHLMRISTADYNSTRAMFGHSTEDAYTVLEVAATATDDELKKAYRRLAAKHHPDKVAHLGEEVQQAAKEKFQQLNQAWEQVKKARGIN
ncbi:MAG: TerB family tellurite resistance protein [Sphingobacteriaceae bacterium]|nr:TerB family tellurite resistance protein [Sphingobacteriaceae bacterium]